MIITNDLELKIGEVYQLKDAYNTEVHSGKYLGEVNKKVNNFYVGGSSSMLFETTQGGSRKLAIVNPSVLYHGGYHRVRTTLLIKEYLKNLKSEQVVTEYVLKEEENNGKN